MPGLVLGAFIYIMSFVPTATLEGCYPLFHYVKNKAQKDGKPEIFLNPLALILIIFPHIVSLWIRT